MLNKLRTTILIVFASFIGFVVAGMSLNGMLDDSPMIPFMQTQPASAMMMTIIRLAAVVAFLAVMVGGLPLAITTIRRAFTVDRHNLGYLLVPVVSFFALVLYFGFVFLLATGRLKIAGVVQVVQPGNFPAGNQLLLAGLMLIFVLGAIASTLAVWKVLSRTDVAQDSYQVQGRKINIEIYKFAYLPAVIASMSMWVILVGTVIWSWIVFSALPQVYSGNFGPWQTSTQGWVYAIISLMLICSLAALFGVMRSRSALAQGSGFKTPA